MSGGSGNKRMVINTRERAISTDQNRGWDLGNKFLVDALHYLFNGDPGVTGTSWDDQIMARGNGTQTFTTSSGPIGTPLEGVILGGLMVICPSGGTELAVQPGAALLMDIDGLTGSPEATAQGSDDSLAKLVIDTDGVLVGSGTLSHTANSSGNIRVDVVEIQRNPAVIESSSRDIYDTTTGLFTSTLVTKIEGADSFTYRIRTGTPGSGLPAAAQGWLPICVIGVPNGSTDFDDCTLYDVRPLARERAHQFTPAEDDEQQAQANMFCEVLDPVGGVMDEVQLYGHYKSTCMGYRIGGQLTSVEGGADVDYIDLKNTDHHSADFTIATIGSWRPMWLMFPGGLPRWVRYSLTNIAPFGGRIPWSQRGIPVMTNTQATDVHGNRPASPIAMPPASGLDSATTATIGVMMTCIPIGDTSSSAAIGPFVVRNNRWAPLVVNVSPFWVWSNDDSSPTYTTANLDMWNLSFGIGLNNVPENAKRLFVKAHTRFSCPASTEAAYSTQVYVSPGNDTVSADPTIVQQPDHSITHNMLVNTAGGNVDAYVNAWVDLPMMRPNTPAFTSVHVTAYWAPGGSVTRSTKELSIVGWEI